MFSEVFAASGGASRRGSGHRYKIISAAASEDGTTDAAASVILKFEKHDFELFRVHTSIIFYLMSTIEYLMMKVAQNRV